MENLWRWKWPWTAIGCYDINLAKFSKFSHLFIKKFIPEEKIYYNLCTDIRFYCCCTFEILSCGKFFDGWPWEVPKWQWFLINLAVDPSQNLATQDVIRTFVPRVGPWRLASVISEILTFAIKWLNFRIVTINSVNPSKHFVVFYYILFVHARFTLFSFIRILFGIRWCFLAVYC